MTKKFIIVLLGFALFSSCIESQNKFSKIPPGIWRGVLYLNPTKLVSGVKKDEVTTYQDDSEQLPFNFEVVYDDEKEFHIEIHNGEERLRVDDVSFGRNPQTAKDTLRIDFTEYDTYLSLVYEEKVMEGYWHVNYKDNYKIKFKAVHGDTSRFKKSVSNPSINMTGRWDVKFEYGTKDQYPGIGVFNQQGNKVTGTFLTETGDYRYLDGIVENDKLYLSCFDGAHAFLFEGKSMKENELTGFFKSGTHYTAPFYAIKNDSITLNNPFELNEITSPDKAMFFTFPDAKGNLVSLSDPKFEGKPKIIEIMGTWCPNCMDATNFLKEFVAEDRENKFQVISIAFERYQDESKNLAQIEKYATKMNLSWPILLGGNYRKSEAGKAIPQLDKIISYPTLLFVDKDNKIVAVHTGFSGPATEEYQQFKEKFQEIINQL